MMLSTFEIPEVETYQSASGSWIAISCFQLNTDKVLRVMTFKSTLGKLTTSVRVHCLFPDGTPNHRVHYDFHCNFRTSHANATEMAVKAWQSLAFISLPEIRMAALKHYEAMENFLAFSRL